jgi:hypothetical protein
MATWTGATGGSPCGALGQKSWSDLPNQTSPHAGHCKKPLRLASLARWLGARVRSSVAGGIVVPSSLLGVVTPSQAAARVDYYGEVQPARSGSAAFGSCSERGLRAASEDLRRRPKAEKRQPRGLHGWAQEARHRASRPPGHEALARTSADTHACGWREVLPGAKRWSSLHRTIRSKGRLTIRVLPQPP